MKKKEERSVPLILLSLCFSVSSLFVLLSLSLLLSWPFLFPPSVPVAPIPPPPFYLSIKGLFFPTVSSSLQHSCADTKKRFIESPILSCLNSLSTMKVAFVFMLIVAVATASVAFDSGREYRYMWSDVW